MVPLHHTHCGAQCLTTHHHLLSVVPKCVADVLSAACSVLYGEELKAALEANPKHMRLDIALSLEQQNAQGGPEYVQVSTIKLSTAHSPAAW